MKFFQKIQLKIQTNIIYDMKTKTSYLNSSKMQALEASENVSSISVGAAGAVAQIGDAAFRASLNARIANYEKAIESRELKRDAQARKDHRASTMLRVRVANMESGHHFFDPEVLAHFGTRIESRLLDGGFFITSERDGHYRPDYDRDYNPLSSTRHYTVRHFNAHTGEITDASAMGEFRSREDALWAAKRLYRSL